MSLVEFFIALVLGFFSSLPIAGPVSVIILRKGLVRKYSEGFIVSLGAGLMEGAYCFGGISFVGFLTKALRLQIFLRIMSSLFFISLGVYLIVRYNSGDNDKNNKTNYRKNNFVNGALLVLFNPAIILSWAVVAAFLSNYEFTFVNPIGNLIFSLGAFFGIFIGLICLMFFVGKFRARFTDRFINRLFKILGIIIIAVGIENFISLGKYF
jgi:threonine/homoserine/homoserine lactone efflux protein